MSESNQESSIFVTASNPNKDMIAPTSPIIDNSNINNLLTPQQPVNNNIETNIEQPLTNDEITSDTANSGIEPIIITDYTKQYDPVIPNQPKTTNKPEFKDILNLIRTLSDQIEKLGYTIDTEEIDLDGSYQVIFNITK